MALKTVQLKLGDALVGVLNIYGTDQPWFLAKFEPTPVFEQFKLLFDDELRFFEDEADFENGTWEEAYQKIEEAGLRLVDAEGKTKIEEFLLHIEGDEAWFRYSEEKFV